MYKSSIFSLDVFMIHSCPVMSVGSILNFCFVFNLISYYKPFILGLPWHSSG